MPGIIPLLAAMAYILASQPSLRMEVIDHPVKEIHALAGYTVFSDGAYGWLECSDGYVDRLVYSTVGTLLHEALHGADCVDDGVVNGSLLPYPPRSDDPAHEWVGWAFTHPEQVRAILEQAQETKEE